MTSSPLHALLHADCQALASETTTATLCCFIGAVIDYSTAAGSSFIWTIWNLMKTCRHSLDEQCFAIEKQAGVSRIIPHECPETVTITAVGLAVPRWLHECLYLIFVATIMALVLWLRIDFGTVMPGRGQRMVNALNAVNGVGLEDLDLEE